MKNALSRLQLLGFVFTGIAGTLLHFAYDWSGENSLVAIFSAVNESTWEHMKLLFFPMFLFALVEAHFLEDQYPNYWCVKLAGIVTGVVSIPVLFYTYTGIFGRSVDWINIAIFFVAAALSYLPETYLMSRGKCSCKSPTVAYALLFLLAIAFILLTWFPPRIPLFQDPTTGQYGRG